MAVSSLFSGSLLYGPIISSVCVFRVPANDIYCAFSKAHEHDHVGDTTALNLKTLDFSPLLEFLVATGAQLRPSGRETMGRKVYVVGVGMTKFEKPGSRAWDYPDMAKESGTKALQDAGIAYENIEQAMVGYCYGESTCGERALYGLGMTGIPIYNVNNNCSTGSTALFMARQFIEGGIADCVMALGFEKMEKGSLGAKYTDRTNPMDKHIALMADLRGFAPAPPAAQMFGNAGREHMERYGTTALQFAKIGWKNHKHSVNNPCSQFQDEYSLVRILSAPMVYEPLTKLQCCPTSDCSGAAILASADFVSMFSEQCDIKCAGGARPKAAAHKAYEQSGLGPENVDVVELHDCFSCNELITYEALGLCHEGKGGEFVDAGANTYGGKVVVNPSGGLISKGHPLGATGLAQCAELNWQLRGEADTRQVSGAKT